MIIKGPIEQSYGNFTTTKWYVSGGRWNGNVSLIKTPDEYVCDCLQFQKYGQASRRCVHIDQVINTVDKV